MNTPIPKLHILAAAALLAGTALTATAVPALPGKRVYTQPDGTQVSLTLRGDESLHYFVDDNGYIIRQDDRGYYRLLDNDGKFTDLQAGKLANLPAARQADLARINPQTVYQSISASGLPMRSAPARISRAGSVPPAKWDNADGHDLRAVPTDGERHVLVILVNFSDIRWSFSDNPGEDMKDMLNKPGFDKFHCTGSARDYFLTSSNGVYQPVFDVFGPVDLPNKSEFYGGNTGAGTTGGSDKNPWQMVIDACNILDDQVDFSIYDTNGDGLVDNVYVLYAGYGENEGAPSWTIWPHSFNLSSVMANLPEYDGVKINRYACSNELTYRTIGDDELTMAGIGTFCHEFSHVLGLPDLYATSYTGAYTPGEFSLMDHGSYNNNGRTPPVYSIYERYALEWQKPVDITSADDLRLLPMSDNGLAYRVTVDPSDPKEYFLFENRQLKDWDQFLPHHGLLVWHIDYDDNTWFYNTVNNDPKHQGIDLVEANNITSSGSETGIPFPGSDKIGTFTGNTTPAFANWSRKKTELPFNNIYEDRSGLVHITVGEGGNEKSPLYIASPSVRLDEVTSASMKIHWNSVAGATDYLVSVATLTTDLFGTYTRTEVPGYSFRSTDGKTSCDITGLDTDTSYVVEVYAVGDNNISTVNANNYFTTAATFAGAVPSLQVSPSNDEATLSWGDVPEAEYYTVTVARRQTGESTVGATIGFDNSLTPAGMLFPGGTYDSRQGYFGQAAPSVRFMSAAGQMTFPSYTSDIESISFWARTNRQNGKVSMKFYSVETDPLNPFEGGNMSYIGEITDVASDATGSTVTLSSIPRGVRQIMMLYTVETTGMSLSIDDIVVRLSGGVTDTPVGQYDDIRVDGTTLLAQGLEPLTDYVAYVTAHNASGDKTVSRDLYFRTTETSGIDGVTIDALRPFSFAGGVVMPLGDRPISVYGIDGTVIASGTLGSVSLPARGLYIVKCGDKAVKINW